MSGPPGPAQGGDGIGRTRAVLALGGLALLAVIWIALRGWSALAPVPPRPDLITDRVHDLVSLLPFAEASQASPHATQRFALIHESDNRDALACLRVPTGTSLTFEGLRTDGPTVLEFGCGVAWSEELPGPDPVRFRIEARREALPGLDDEPPDSDDLGGVGGADSGDGWTMVFNEVIDPAQLPAGRQAVQRRLELPGSGPNLRALRFTTRRAGGEGLALPWPGFLSPQLLSHGRLRTLAEHQLDVASVSEDLLATLGEARILEQDEELPVVAAVLDAAKGYSAAGGRRTSLRAVAPSRIAYTLQPRSGATLEFAVGMDTVNGWMKRGDGMLFAVEIDGERVWSRMLRAPTVEADRGWKPGRVDLSRWVGKPIELQLITETLGTPNNDVGGWSNVLLLRRDRVPRLLADEAPTVLLVLVDTLRADRLGVYGNSSGLSPNLDAMARQGLFFARAQAASSWTWPSTASVLTGVPPNVHGVQDSQHSYLVDAHVTLPELFSRAGYTTAGFSSNLLIGRADNFQQGFETFVHTPYASARAMNDRVTAWLDGTEGLARFAYIHYFDPHTPYLPPPGWMLPMPEGVRPETELAPLAAEQLAGGGEPDPALVEEYRTLLMTQYDSEVRYFDHAFGELLVVLEEQGVLENCVIAFTSDHGEEFYEHRFFSHGGHLYDETLGVPLWITAYGRAAQSLLAPGTAEHPVSNQDLLPTLCALAGVSIPGSELPEVLQGQVLTGESPGGGGRRPVFGQTWHGHLDGSREFTEKLSVTSGPYKLIHTPATKSTELYDRGADPGETVDMVDDPAHQATLEVLQTTLRAWDHLTRAAARGIRVEGDDDALAMLRALGYVGDEDGSGDGD